MTVDLILAILHHLTIFALVALLAMEAMLLKPGLDVAGLKRLGFIDGIYGATAGAIVIVGFARVFFGLKPAEFYLTNPVFWLKIVAFVLVGLFSVPPTLAILRWRKQVGAGGALPDAGAVAGARRWLIREMMAFPFIPIFAAVMARGYGL